MPKESTLPPIDAGQRYDVPEALRYLRCSRKSLYQLIAAGDIKTITMGVRRMKHGERAGRRYIPGSEILRLSQAPAT